jgi:hypothetical protein
MAITTVKMFILIIAINNLNEITVKIPIVFSIEIETKQQRCQLAKVT